MQLFPGKVAIVTGGASGIGAAIVRDIAAEGGRVVVADYNEDGAVALAEELGRDTALPFKIDVADPDGMAALVRFAVDSFGALHLAVNNAGVGAPPQKLADIDVADWRRIIDVDLSSVFYGMKFQIPAILKSGGGAIVNMASILGAVARAGQAGYVTAKHGVIGMTKIAAIDYADQPIRINAVGPGFIAPPAVEAMDPAEKAGLAGLHPLDRLGTPQEVAALTSFLLSDKASFMTGTYYPLDGGYLAL